MLNRRVYHSLDANTRPWGFAGKRPFLFFPRPEADVSGRRGPKSGILGAYSLHWGDVTGEMGVSLPFNTPIQCGCVVQAVAQVATDKPNPDWKRRGRLTHIFTLSVLFDFLRRSLAA